MPTDEASREQLSTLMDGELERDQMRFLLRRCERDSELNEVWSRYHLVQSCIRREFFAPGSVSWSTRVMREIDGIAVPSATRGGSRWLHWGAGGAIAAGVAVAALMVTQPLNQGAMPGRSVMPVVDSGASAAANNDNLAAAPTPSQRQDSASSLPADSVASSAQDMSTLLSSQPSPVMNAQPASAVFGGDGRYLQAASFQRESQPFLIRHYQASGSGNAAEVAPPYVLWVVPQGASDSGHQNPSRPPQEPPRHLP